MTCEERCLLWGGRSGLAIGVCEGLGSTTSSTHRGAALVEPLPPSRARGNGTFRETGEGHEVAQAQQDVPGCLPSPGQSGAMLRVGMAAARGHGILRQYVGT